MRSFVRNHCDLLRVVLAGLMVATGVGSRGIAQTEESDNPFRPTGGAAPAAVSTGNAELDALQFSGLSSIGTQRSFNFTDARTRKSFWIPLNGTENGFSVVSYDETNEQVVVRYGTHQRPLSLRKAVLVAAPGAPTAGPTRPAATTVTAAAPQPRGSGVDEIKNPKTPAEIKQAEYEARMLVSDLLDISMKAREEQRKLREAQQRGRAAPLGGTSR